MDIKIPFCSYLIFKKHYKHSLLRWNKCYSIHPTKTVNASCLLQVASGTTSFLFIFKIMDKMKNAILDFKNPTFF